MKKFSIIIVLVMYILSRTCINAYGIGGSDYSEKPTEGQESPYGNYGSDFHIVTPNKVDGTIDSVTPGMPGGISSYGNKIAQVSSGYIYGYSTCSANIIVDEVGYTLYFQKWDGNNWVNVSSVVNSKINDISIEGYHYKSVTPSQYYRVMATFYTYDDGVKDTKTAISDYIYVY